MTLYDLEVVKRLVQSAAIIPFIRRLHLLDLPWVEALPLLVGFESIRTLFIRDLLVRHLNSHILSVLLCNFSAAVVVRLEDVEFGSVAQLVHFICSFPRLQRLAINCIRASDEFGSDLPPPTAFSLSPHLHDLELNGVCMDPVLDWLLSLPDRPALHAVGLRPTRLNNFDTITKFLLALQDSLETLLISTATANGMFVIFPNLIHNAYEVRTAMASVRPTPQHTFTHPSI